MASGYSLHHNEGLDKDKGGRDMARIEFPERAVTIADIRTLHMEMEIFISEANWEMVIFVAERIRHLADVLTLRHTAS